MEHDRATEDVHERKFGDDELSDAINCLQALVSGLQLSVERDPENLDDALAGVAHTTSKVISSALPPAHRDKWLAEMETITSVKQKTRDIPPRGQESHECCCQKEFAPHKFVTCYHGCDTRFCSASCRKKMAREHAKVCAALSRKRLLRKMGLPVANDEMF